jgi:hypothetical protein
LCASTAFWSQRLRPTLAWLENTPCPSLDAGEKAIIAERPADTLGGAQAIEHIRLRLDGKQIGEAGEAVPDRRQRGEPVVPAAQMRTPEMRHDNFCGRHSKMTCGSKTKEPSISDNA